MSDRDQAGKIEIYCGPMFSGKTEATIQRLWEAEATGLKTQAFKPVVESRIQEARIVSHTGLDHEAISIEKAVEMLSLIESCIDVVAIDEVQFLDQDIIMVVLELETLGVKVIVNGLDLDFRGEPFGFIPQLLCFANEIHKLHATCAVCGHKASRTQRLINGETAHYDNSTILVGGREIYEPRCRRHHVVLPVRSQEKI